MDLLERLRTCLADRYRIERELGRGGMATVYLAGDLKHDRLVALKVLRPEISYALGGERFLREIAIAARLQHPHILGLFDSGAADGALWYTMPYVEGESLRARLAREVQLEAAEAVRIAGEVADALACAHAAGVIHRDIKPENILLASRHAMVADFGIAHALDVAGGSRLTETGLALGTPQYMSPEQATGGREVDARCDVYALGCVVYEMLVGEPPFNGPTPQAVLARHSIDPVPRLRTVRPGLSPELEAVVTRSLGKVPADRYATALEFKDALAAALQGRGGGPDTTRPTGRRRPVAALGIGLAALALVGLWMGRAGRQVVAPDAASPIRSLAVMPFTNLTGDSGQVYLAAGITDQLVTMLSQVDSVRVVALKGPQADTPKEVLAREHGIDAVLSGALQRSGEQVRITVQLSAIPAGRSLWARSYDGEMQGILSLQDQVAGSVAERISARPRRETPAGAASRPRDVNPAAYEAYVRGMYFLGKVTEADFKKGIGYFAQAIDIEPAYADAYYGLAECYGELAYYALGPPAELVSKSRAAALKALELDSMLAGAHATLGKAELLYSWDFGAAGREFRRAVELQPNSGRMRLHYQWYLAAMGRREESIAEAERSIALDPLSLIIQAAASRPYYNARRYAEALAQARKTLEMDSTFSRAHFWVGLAQEQMGRPEEAIRALEETVARAGRISVYLAALGHAYAGAGHRAKAMAILNELRERARSSYISPFDLATVYLGLGMRDETFAALEDAYAGRAYGLVFMQVDPRFDPIRSDPRYGDLVRRVGLPGS